MSYSLGGADASSFDIGLTTGIITVATGTKLDYETKDTYMVTVIATDSYDESSSIAVTITVTDENEGPEVTGQGSVNYPEKGTGNVATYTATDPENAGAVEWSLEGEDAEDFEIGESSGVLTFAEVPDYEDAADGDTADASSFDVGLTTGIITVATGTKLDYETKDTYMVTVIATDSYDESSSHRCDHHGHRRERRPGDKTGRLRQPASYVRFNGRR